MKQNFTSTPIFCPNESWLAKQVKAVREVKDQIKFPRLVLNFNDPLIGN